MRNEECGRPPTKLEDAELQKHFGQTRQIDECFKTTFGRFEGSYNLKMPRYQRKKHKVTVLDTKCTATSGKLHAGPGGIELLTACLLDYHLFTSMRQALSER